MYDHEKSTRHSSCEADEQSRATGCGVGGAKGGSRGECELAKHGPGTVPGNRVTGAEAHTASSPLDTQGGSRMPELGPYGWGGREPRSEKHLLPASMPR